MEERLTKYLASGVADYDYPADCYSGDDSSNRVAKSAYRQTCVERLAVYEDTGLTPESVEALKLSMIGKAISEITEFEGLPIERLKELARADKEGRVVLLPFSDSVDVEIKRNGIAYKSDHWNITLSAFAYNQPTPSGMKVGLFSGEEAEKALEEKKDG